MTEQGIVQEEATEVPRTGVRVRPTGDRILVMEVPGEVTTPAGVVLPDTARGSTQRGVVAAVGPGPRSPLTGEVANMGFEVGQEILYAQMAGQEITVDGVPLLVLRETDVVCVLEPPEEEEQEEEGAPPE